MKELTGDDIIGLVVGGFMIALVVLVWGISAYDKVRRRLASPTPPQRFQAFAGAQPSAPQRPAQASRPLQAPAKPAHPPIIARSVWWPIVTKESVHVRLIGPTNSGKSVLAQALAQAFDGRLCIIDPVWKMGNWGGLPAVTVDADGEYGPIKQALEGIIAEMKRRGAQLQTDEAPTFERITILFDEVPDTVTELPDHAGLLVRRLGQRGRHANMHLIGMAQSERVKAWGIEGYGDTAENFATIYLGQKAIDRMAWLADAAQFPAVLEWRGKAMPIDTRECLELSQKPISAGRVWNPFETPTA